MYTANTSTILVYIISNTENVMLLSTKSNNCETNTKYPIKYSNLQTTNRGESLQSTEAVLLRSGGLLESLVFLDEGLHLVYSVSQFLRHQIWLLCDQPRLGDGRVAGELVHLQNWKIWVNTCFYSIGQTNSKTVAIIVRLRFA